MQTRSERILRWLATLLLLLFSQYVSIGAAKAGPSGKGKIDPLTGLSWDTLIKGNLPDNLFRERFDPQREYLRKTYGEEISTTYDLFLKERARTGESKEL